MQRLDGDGVELELLPQLGGRCHRIRVGGHDLLRVPEEPSTAYADPLYWGWFPLVPWSNRVPGGLLVWRGRTIHLPPNEPGGSAIHGHGWAASWQVQGEGHFEMHHQAGDFPWTYRATQRWSLDGTTLSQELSVTNLSDEDMPAGLGIHPWWSAQAGFEVDVPSRAAYDSRSGLAIGEPEPAPPLRGRVPWGTDQLFTDLDDRSIGLRWPRWGITAELRHSASADHVQVAAFEELDAVAVEPVTHAGDGHRRLAEGRSGAIGVLPSGHSMSLHTELTISV